MTYRIVWTSLLLMLLSGATNTALSASITVAVASNFYPTARVLADEFERESRHTVRFAQGSTGQHYAQIRQGAPYELFLAADSDRPALLEQKRIAVPDTRRTYAEGRLVLWVPTATETQPARDWLIGQQLPRLALANEQLAPYGAAAEAVLINLGLKDSYRGRRVRGRNIAQTYQYIATGNAQGGFVALSQVVASGPSRPVFWQVPVSLHPPIQQQMILLADTPAARRFWGFLQSPEAVRRIGAAGYTVGQP